MYVDDDTYEFLIEMIDKKINEIKNGYNPYARCGKVMDAERRGFAINSLRELKKEFGQNNLHFSHCKYFKRPFQVNQSSCIGYCQVMFDRNYESKVKDSLDKLSRLLNTNVTLNYHREELVVNIGGI